MLFWRYKIILIIEHPNKADLKKNNKRLYPWLTIIFIFLIYSFSIVIIQQAHLYYQDLWKDYFIILLSFYLSLIFNLKFKTTLHGKCSYLYSYVIKLQVVILHNIYLNIDVLYMFVHHHILHSYNLLFIIYLYPPLSGVFDKMDTLLNSLENKIIFFFWLSFKAIDNHYPQMRIKSRIYFWRNHHGQS